MLLSPCHTEGTILLTNQRTVCVAQTCRHPFKHLSTPTEEYCETSMAQYSSYRILPTFGGGNATHAAPLQTEPTRNLRWKSTISPDEQHEVVMTELSLLTFTAHWRPLGPEYAIAELLYLQCNYYTVFSCRYTKSFRLWRFVIIMVTT